MEDVALWVSLGWASHWWLAVRLLLVSVVEVLGRWLVDGLCWSKVLGVAGNHCYLGVLLCCSLNVDCSSSHAASPDARSAADKPKEIDHDHPPNSWVEIVGYSAVGSIVTNLLVPIACLNISYCIYGVCVLPAALQA